MRYLLGTLVICFAASLGCGKPVASTGTAETTEGEGTEAESKAVEVKIAEDGSVKLGPDNTRIGFVAIHTGDDPKPRTGGFEKFDGKIQLDADKKNVESIEVEIPVDSIWTEFAGLTAHLKKEDFFHVEEIPSAKFVSTKIEPGEKDGEINVTGDLTMHGVTKEITFPATVKITDGTLELDAKFKLMQSEHDMVKDGVADGVEVEVKVGEKTEKLPERNPLFG